MGKNDEGEGENLNKVAQYLEQKTHVINVDEDDDSLYLVFKYLTESQVQT